MMAVMAGYGKQYEGSVKTTQAMNSAIVEYIGGIEVIKPSIRERTPMRSSLPGYGPMPPTITTG